MFFQETTIFPSGGESNYRIPSLIVTNNGTVIAFCDYRHGILNFDTEWLLQELK